MKRLPAPAGDFFFALAGAVVVGNIVRLSAPTLSRCTAETPLRMLRVTSLQAPRRFIACSMPSLRPHFDPAPDTTFFPSLAFILRMVVLEHLAGELFECEH